ncbi:MAG TPA: hypothetical protein VGR94_04190 [Candidatus Acidoferrales bacterium]|nr:hypothetical protein [Candidatus Acidoferrales bacterium]
MKRLATVLFAVSLFSLSARSAPPAIGQVHVNAGSVLNFQLQTRLKASNSDAMDEFPAGTVVRVKMLETIDSTRDADGTPFRGVLVSSLASGTEIVAHTDAAVTGMLVLLRSREHPEGFRYVLLVTRISDGGKSYPVTASLSSSLYDSSDANAKENRR